MASGDWFIIETNPNCEAKAVSEIRRAGFRAYLPKRAQDFRHHRTKRQGIRRRPALVGYVFMRFPDGPPNWYAIRQCQGVKGVIYCDGRPYELARSQVAAVMRDQRRMTYDMPNARVIRKARLTGERHALARAKFTPGSKVYDPASGIIARVVAVTKRGTVKAITDMPQEVPVEFSETDRLNVLAETEKAA